MIDGLPAHRQFGNLFERHLDLTPLRGRPRGVTFCRFHPDRKHRSLSVDLERGLFHCFACGVGGGVFRFARLVGEVLDTQNYAATYIPAASVLGQGLWLAKTQAWARPGVGELYCIADWLRALYRQVLTL